MAAGNKWARGYFDQFHSRRALADPRWCLELAEVGEQRVRSVDQATRLRDAEGGPCLPAIAHTVAGGVGVVATVRQCPHLMHFIHAAQYSLRSPEYHECKLRTSDIEHCLELAGRAIVCANWLAATARKELARFKEFISWLRWGT